MSGAIAAGAAAGGPAAAELLVPVSWGELLDKITILEIKAARIADPVKLANVRRELAALEAVRDRHPWRSEATAALVEDLRAVNAALWDIEDRLREHERGRDFGPGFVLRFTRVRL